MSQLDRCPKCGATLPPGRSDEVCPRCLLQMAMSPVTTGYSRGADFSAPSIAELERAFPQLKIEAFIGQGGMGAVYRARQRGLDRVIALKILPPGVAAREGFAQRFEREARAMARLSHPHIVAVYDSGRAGEFFYLTMEYVDGINLRQAIQAQQMTCEEALQVIPQICDALQYAHDQGIVHRDIKPENILLNSHGQIKIADFGLARMLDQSPINPTLTAAHQVLGTPRYMAPEQIEGTHAVDHRADIYSLGVVFYELLTGELPLGRFSAPSQKPGIDKRLDEVVYRTLEKKPEQRYQHASELKTDVEQITLHVHHHHGQGQTGYEYKSSLRLLGLPWIHVATGRDPLTGRKRIAKGFFAVGDIAMGVFAVGGVSIGVFSLGGVSLGLFCLGGLALGLLLALGGLSISTGIAVGGVSLGAAALGGMAVGYVALGGAAFGEHALGGNGAYQDDRVWFEMLWNQMPSVRTWLFGIVSTVVGLILFILFSYKLARLTSRQRGSIEPQPTLPVQKPSKVPPVIHPNLAVSPKSSSAWGGCLLAIAILIVPVVLLGMLVLGAVFAYRKVGQPNVQGSMKTERATVRPNEYDGTAATDEGLPSKRPGSVQDTWLAVDYLAGVPIMSQQLVAELGIDQEQEERLNVILRESHAIALGLTGTPFSALAVAHGESAYEFGPGNRNDFHALSESFWLRCSEVLNETQLQQARQRIHVFPEEPPLKNPKDVRAAVYPSLFQWAGYPAKVTVSRSASGYHWTLECQQRVLKSSGPQLPPELHRFAPERN